MDYIKNIEEAVKAFEFETKRLSNYTNLLGAIKDLITAIQSEKDILNSTTEEIKKAEVPIHSTYEALKEQCENLKRIIDEEQSDNKTIKDVLTAVLTDYLDKETAARDNLSNQIKASVREDTVKLFNNLINHLKEDRDALHADGELLSNLIDEQRNAIEETEKVVAALTVSLSEFIEKEKSSRAESVDKMNNSIENMVEPVITANEKILEALNLKTKQLEKQIVETNELVVKNMATINEKVDAKGIIVKKEFDVVNKKIEVQTDKLKVVQNSLNNVTEGIGGNNKEIASVKVLCISAIAVGIFNIIMLFMIH